MSRLSPELSRLLVIRGLARALAPIAVLWGIYDWWTIHPLYALIFALLAGNYILVYILSWVAPGALNGPWRIRPWQTFVLLINAVLLPIVFKRTHGELPWGFIAITVLFVIGLYVGTYILLYLNERLPMAGIFMARRGGMIPSAPPADRQPCPSTPQV